MNTDRIIVLGAFLALVALLVWIEIRRDVSRMPGLKKLKWWQLVGLYLIVWIVVSLIVEALP